MIQGEQGVARISLCQRHLSDVVPLWDGEGELLLPFCGPVMVLSIQCPLLIPW